MLKRLLDLVNFFVNELRVLVKSTRVANIRQKIFQKQVFRLWRIVSPPSQLPAICATRFSKGCKHTPLFLNEQEISQWRIVSPFPHLSLRSLPFAPPRFSKGCKHKPLSFSEQEISQAKLCRRCKRPCLPIVLRFLPPYRSSHRQWSRRSRSVPTLTGYLLRCSLSRSAL